MTVTLLRFKLPKATLEMNELLWYNVAGLIPRPLLHASARMRKAPPSVGSR